MKKTAWLVCLLTALALLGCDKGDQMDEDQQSVMGYGQSEEKNQVAPVPEGSDSAVTVKPSPETEKMMKSMQETVDKMAEEFADTVDTIKKGADKTAEDLGESMNEMKKKGSEAADSMNEEISKKLQEMKESMQDEALDGTGEAADDDGLSL